MFFLTFLAADFSLPEEGGLFDTIEYVEQKPEPARKLLEKYYRESKENTPHPPKCSRVSCRHGKTHQHQSDHINLFVLFVYAS